VVTGLAAWLAAHTPASLAALLARRPEATVAPAPRNLVELAYRLEHPYGVSAAFAELPLPCVQLIEAILGLGTPGRDDLAGLVAGPPAQVDRHLATLAGRALVWPHDGRLEVSGPLREGIECPLSLGEPAGQLLARRTAADLRALAVAVGLSGAARLSRRAQVQAALVDWYDDPARVRALYQTAPPAARTLLEQAAYHGPEVDTPGGWYPTTGPVRSSPLDWALRHGLLVPSTWQAAEMPREVALALRGPGWHPPFDPDPPALATVTVDPRAVRREAAAAATAALDQVAGLLHECSGTPVALLKAGGVGAREQRRLARALAPAAPDEPAVRLWLELAAQAGLLVPQDGVLLVAPAADDWLAAEPAVRLVALLTAWWRLPAVPLLGTGTAVPAAVLPVAGGPALVRLRQAVLGALVELAPDTALADPAALAPVVRWRLPVLLVALDDVGAAVAPLLREAALLGAAGRGTATVFGRALAGGDEPGLATAAAELLDRPVGTAIFQADLTVVVPGSPDPALTALLDAAARRESRGTASTWRFSAGSVRQALDGGYAADVLVTALAAVAAGGELPQALTYLVADVARRHGQVRVRPAGCVLRGEDPAQLREIAAATALRSLGLTVVAPTVLTSTADVTRTLAALRAAGYAPVAEDGDGVPVVELAPVRRAAVPEPRGTRPARTSSPRRPGTAAGRGYPAAPADPAVLARDLLAAAVPVAPAGTAAADRVRAAVVSAATALNPAEQELLAYAIDGGYPVRIDYVNAAGNRTSRVIEPDTIEGGTLVAWCRLREDERMFRLSRISAVVPA